MTTNINNGLITKIWGPGAWEFLHSVTFGYPVSPTDKEKQNYKDFFMGVGDILPCGHCRDSYKIFITENDTLIDDNVLNSRDGLTEWLYQIHEKVNNKLDDKYNLTYEDVQKKYESYRAKCVKQEKGCITPLNKKTESYKNAYNKNCSIISHDIVIHFLQYARLRGFHMADFYYIKNDLTKIESNKCCDIWCKRNDECHEIIKNMRLYGTPSLEANGKFKGLPTLEELKLIVRYSSNLTSNELISLISKLPKYNKQNYVMG
jgi:hypothetical protein